MSTNHHPYYIVAPDYRDNSAGVRVMHRLCDLLNASGNDAYIVGAEHLNPSLRTPLLDDATLTRHRRQRKVPIAVYSDIVTGNPLNASVCVRYMLNKEGTINGNKINADKADLFFYYSPAFTPDEKGPFHYLRLHTHDLDLFQADPLSAKTGPLLYLNRIPVSAIDFSALPADIELLSNLHPLSLTELAKKLQSATALYSYESSGTCTLAMLCGCPVVAMTLPGFEQLGFSRKALAPYGGCGYALTDSESDLQSARDSLPRFRQGMLNVARALQNELLAFIDITQQYATGVADAPTCSLLRHNSYQDWISTRGHLEVPTRTSSLFENLTNPPRFHLVVVDDYKTPLELARTLRSLAGQQYPGVLVTVISPLSAPEDSNSQRLEWLQGEHVWESAALALSKTDPDVWVGLVVAGDALACHSLQALARHLDAHPQLQAVYTDEDIVEDFGTRHSPRFKPDFDPRLLRDSGYLGGLLLAKNQVWQAAGGWRHLPGNDEEWDLALRLAKIVPAAFFGHFADVLYHRGSKHPALKSTARLCSVPGVQAPAPKALAQPQTPLVSILIPTRDQLPALQRCIESLFEHTPGTSFELILVDHDSSEAGAVAFLSGLPAAAPDRIQVLKASGGFNFSALINLAARHARGKFLLLLNNDTAALHPEWLPALLAEMIDPEVGIVSPRLVFPDGRIQHAGAILGLSCSADYPWVGASMDDPGYLGLLAHSHTVSAVNGAALLIRRELFESLGGLDERYTIAYGDIDLCLRVGQAGYRCIWTPESTLMHEAGLTLMSVFNTPDAAENAQQQFEQDRHRLLKQWLTLLARDPAYNINLSLNSRKFELETEPVLQAFVAGTSDQLRAMALPADDNGSGVYRVCMPALEANSSGLAATRLSKGYPHAIHFERLEIRTLYSQRQVDDSHLNALSELRDLLPRLRIVMDFDDLLTEISPHNFYFQDAWKDMPRRLKQLGRLCDVFTVSTEPLANAMRDFHDHVVTIPNGIDPSQWKRLSRRPHGKMDKLRVGWVGGYSHAGDLALIREVVSKLARDVDWITLGMCLEDSKPHLKEFYPVVPFAQYPNKFASLDLDLALAPLEMTHFNECKSNLRLLENGILGIPVIATDITPYQCGLPVTLLGNQPDKWIRAIKDRIGEHDALAKEGEALRAAVLAKWTVNHMLEKWMNVWTGNEQTGKQ